MVEAAHPLTSPYGAYNRRDVPREDDQLTHVGPGTLCGEWLRRFWQPVALSAELRDLPKAIRIMGEELVIFRDRGGRVGLLDRHCSHRGTSLEFGLVSERGIRCCYHGWLYDVDGRILEIPGEPAESTYKDRFYHGAYPALEYEGLVFAYMGPPDRRPEFPIFDTYGIPGYRLVPSGQVNFLPCNWLQIKENSMDPIHTAFLHTIVSGVQFTPAYADIGVLDWQETPTGMVYIHTRRVDDRVWVHMNDYIPPNIHQFPPTWQDAREETIFLPPMATNWSVPIDDTLTMNLGFRHVKEGEPERYRPFGQTDDRPYEERQRQPGDYDAQVSQRPIALHALEHLVSHDRGIVMLRTMVRQGIRAVERGEDPTGVVRTPGGVLPTYSNDTILRIPPASTPGKDRELLQETGRRVAAEYLRNPSGPSREGPQQAIMGLARELAEAWSSRER